MVPANSAMASITYCGFREEAAESRKWPAPAAKAGKSERYRLPEIRSALCSCLAAFSSRSTTIKPPAAAVSRHSLRLRAGRRLRDRLTPPVDHLEECAQSPG